MLLLVFVILVLIVAAVTAVHAYVNGAKEVAASLTIGVVAGIIAIITGEVNAQ